MRLLWGNQSRLLRAGRGYLEEGSPVVGRIQPRALGLGLGKEASYGPAWLTVRHDRACTVKITPIMDGVTRDDLTMAHDLDEPSGVVDTKVRVPLSQVMGYSKQALRCSWFSLRVEVNAKEDFGVLAVGGLEIEVRQLNPRGVQTMGSY